MPPPSPDRAPRNNLSTSGDLQVRYDAKLLSDLDLHLFNEGRHFRLYRKLGSHVMEWEGTPGVHFAVWAPNAESVSVIGAFNSWQPDRHLLRPVGSSGIWAGFIPHLPAGELYKYRIVSRYGGICLDKADPFAFRHERPPGTSSMVWDLAYDWNDAQWLAERSDRQAADSPISIYEMHLGSWRRSPENGGRFLTYRELAACLPEYLVEMGFSHVEFLPVMEHPFYGSWGYQCLGYFAPTSRYGPPQDFMALIDALHRAGIGVILDWVPSHFPNDAHGLGFFDGTHLYEHADPRLGVHPDWNSYIFNYGRNEVRSFLISSALFWLAQYHADGLRVDAVASMLYRDYSRPAGGWIPNRYGGRENLEAIDMLRTLNQEIETVFPGVQTVAEESTAWPGVSRPVSQNGLGFTMKWDMGWMHDTLRYLTLDPIHRSYHHDRITFRMLYAFEENFVLPLSHDEVVHGKGSLLQKMPGDKWQKFANLRLLLGYMFAQSGKKLLFMGGEFGLPWEWNHDGDLGWDCLKESPHEGLQRWVRDLNYLYRSEDALHAKDFDPRGFQWIDCNDAPNSTLLFLRQGSGEREVLLVACNFTPLPRPNYPAGVPVGGFWCELLNSDAREYWGSGTGNMGKVMAAEPGWHGRPYRLSLTLPPLGILFLKPLATDRARAPSFPVQPS